MKSGSSRTAALVWAAVMIAVLSSTLTLLFAGRGTGSQHWVSEDEYEMVARYRRLDEVRNILTKQYYEPLDEQQLVTGAIRGMTAAVKDVYTFYYTPEEMTRENENESGRYHGIGVLIEQNQEGYIEVLKVYPGTPAETAGLQAGDIIVGVDGSFIGETGGKLYDDAVALIRGEENTRVSLTILRAGERLEISVLRADVNVSYVDYTMLDDGIGYVAISQFTGDAADKFQEAIAYFRAQQTRGLVIDVRNNPGGLLNQVNSVADSLLPEGLIVYVQDRDGKRNDYYSDAAMYDVPLVVIVNEMSASASEILAASVQALGRGKVVGLTTYGKGVVQSLISFEEDGAGIQLTTASYYDADGRSIHGVGVTPDVEVALDGERVPLTPDPISDSQLSKALEVLEEEIEQKNEEAPQQAG